MTGQIQKVVQKEKKTLHDKLHLMAETLRNCELRQGRYTFYEIDTKEREKFCAYGALGFLSGIPKDVLKGQPYDLVLEKYGITKEEKETLVDVLFVPPQMERTMPLEQAIYYMNDIGLSFKAQAYWLDNLQG